MMLTYINSLHKPLSLGWGRWLVEWRCVGTGWQHCYEVHQEVVGWNSWSCIPGKLCLFYSKMATETADHAFQVYSIVLFEDGSWNSWSCIPGIHYLFYSKMAAERADDAFQVYFICFVQRWRLVWITGILGRMTCWVEMFVYRMATLSWGSPRSCRLEQLIMHSR